MNTKTNYWPIGITLLIGVVVLLIIWTVNFAIKNPVELELICNRAYQDVDENINQMQQESDKFNEKYKAYFSEVLLQKADKIIQLELNLEPRNKDTTNELQNAKVHFYLTRPLTNKENKDIGNAISSEQLPNRFVFFSNTVTLEQLKGRWKAEAYIEIGEDKTCIAHSYEVF